MRRRGAASIQSPSPRCGAASGTGAAAMRRVAEHLRTFVRGNCEGTAWHDWDAQLRRERVFGQSAASTR